MTDGLVVGGIDCGGDVVAGAGPLAGRTVLRMVVGVAERVGEGAGGGMVVVGGAVEVVVDEVVVVVVEVVEVEVVVAAEACSRTPSPGVLWGTPAMPIPRRIAGTTTASAT